MSDLRDTAVLFDWNGTIVLDAERARLALNAVLDSRGLASVSPDDFGFRFRLPMRELFVDLGVSEPELVAAEAEWNDGMLGDTAIARDGVADALIALKLGGARTGVVSAAAEASIRADLDYLGLGSPWDLVSGGVSDKTAELVEQRGNRGNAIYVGDTVYDIQCAVAANYRAVGVSGGYTSPERLVEAGAEWIIEDLTDLIPIVQRLSERAPANS